MVKLDNNGLEFNGIAPDIEAEIMSIMVAWMIQLDKHFDVSYVFEYIKDIANVNTRIVDYIKQGESVDEACLKATRDMLKETENGIQR